MPNDFSDFWSYLLSKQCCVLLAFTIEDNRTGASLNTVKTIKKTLFVDGGLKSYPHVGQAISCIQELRKLLSASGFNLTKFTGNHAEMLESVAPSDYAPSIQSLDFDEMPTQKVLCTLWHA